MKTLAEALEKIVALEKHIEELEKRPAVVIHNHPQPQWGYYTPTPQPTQPYYIGDVPFHTGPTCGTILCASRAN